MKHMTNTVLLLFLKRIFGPNQFSFYIISTVFDTIGSIANGKLLEMILDSHYVLNFSTKNTRIKPNEMRTNITKLIISFFITLGGFFVLDA